MAQASLRIRAVLPEPSLFAHMKYGSRRWIRQKIRHLAPLDGCACVFEECSKISEKLLLEMIARRINISGSFI